MIIQDTRTDGKRRWKIMFDNVDEVQSWLRETPRTWSSTSSTSTGEGRYWDLGLGWEGALRMAHDGWLEGVKDLAGKLAMRPPSLTNEPKWRYDVAGERPDVGRYLSGDPANMMRHGHPKGKRPVITLAIGANAIAAVSAEQMANYGAAMVAVIDQLESTGRRVEAYATFVSSVRDSGRICPYWRVKKASDPVDLSALAFSLSHPAAFRRLGFAIYERSGFATQPGYGSSCGSTKEDLIDPNDDTLVISGLADHVGGRCRTLDDAILFAAEQINQAAGEELVIL